MKFIKALLIAVPLTTFVCTPTFGEDSSLETNVYDFVDDYGNYNLTQTTDASSSLTSLTINGVEIKVGLTAWSDTGIIDPSYYYGNVSEIFSNLAPTTVSPVTLCVSENADIDILTPSTFT